MNQTRQHSKLIVGISDVPFDLIVNPSLTQREKEILKYIRSPDKNIAYDLNISYRTVVNHMVSIRRKTGCKSKSELAYYMARTHLIN
jgi:DNA-binding CsgD family transcriptional regulator